MSEQFEVDKNINYNHKIVYDYPHTQVLRNEISMRTDSQPFFKAQYNSTVKREPNLFYINNTDNKSLSSKNCYVYKLIHNNIAEITNDDAAIVGELIIENVNDKDLVINIIYVFH